MKLMKLGILSSSFEVLGFAIQGFVEIGTLHIQIFVTKPTIHVGLL